MTDFQKIQNELTSLGWTMQNGRGDHKTFCKNGKKVSVSLSLSTAARNYQNKLAEIRRLEPEFTLGKPVKSKTDQRSQEILEGVLNMSEEEKTTARKYMYISEGQKVRYTSPEKKDWSKLKDSGSVMNIPYLVFEIISESKRKYITSEQDTVIITDADLSHEISVKPSDLDAWDTKTCSGCGQLLPVNMFAPGKELCNKCLKEKNMIADEMKKSVSDLMTKNDLPLSPTVRGWKDLPVELQDLILKNENIDDMMHMSPDALVEHYKKLKTELEKFFRSKIGKNMASELKKNLDVIKNAAAVACGDKKISLYEASRLFSGRLAKHDCDKFRHLEGVTEKDFREFKKKIYEISLDKVVYGDITVVNVSIVSPLVLYAVLADSESLYNALEGTFSKGTTFYVRLICKKLDYKQFVPYWAMTASQTLEDLEKNCPHEELGLTCQKLHNLSWWNEKKFRSIANAAIETAIKMKRLTDEDADNVKLGIAHVYAGNVDDAECVKNYYLFSQYGTVGFMYVTNECADAAKAADGLRSVIREIYPAICQEIGNNYIHAYVTAENAGDDDYQDGAVCEFRMMKPEPEVTVTMKITGYIVPKLEEKGKGDPGEGIIAILNEWENAQSINPKPIQKDMISKTEGFVPEKTTEFPVQETVKQQDSIQLIDRTNPDSDNAALRNVTAREMLVELKKRGVEFKGLSVPVIVKQTVNLEDL